MATFSFLSTFVLAVPVVSLFMLDGKFGFLTAHLDMIWISSLWLLNASGVVIPEFQANQIHTWPLAQTTPARINRTDTGTTVSEPSIAPFLWILPRLLKFLPLTGLSTPLKWRTFYPCAKPPNLFPDPPSPTDCSCFFHRQLMENQIGAIERGVFDDMKELERL